MKKMKNIGDRLMISLIATGLIGVGCTVQDTGEDGSPLVDDGLVEEDQTEDQLDDDSLAGAELSQEVDRLMDRASREAFIEAGLEIYSGDHPPQIEGIYRLNTAEIVFDDRGRWLPLGEYTFTLFDQTDRGRISMNFEAAEADDLADGVDSYIIGRDNCFSLFFDAEGLSNGCAYRLPSVVSGCLTEDGITQWKHGFVMGASAASKCAAVLPKGYRRMVVETDGVAHCLSQDSRPADDTPTTSRSGVLVGLGRAR